eukprot:g71388.t1
MHNVKRSCIASSLVRVIDVFTLVTPRVLADDNQFSPCHVDPLDVFQLVMEIDVVAVSISRDCPCHIDPLDVFFVMEIVVVAVSMMF